jgi:hypothetical protein
MASNLFCRGWLQPAYYYLGSDYRAAAGDAYTLSYMAQMGGWAILDHALHDVDDPRALLRLGHASALSSWALLNSGTPESGHGYWYPGPANDGGAAGGFEPAALGKTWLDQPHHHGAWYYSCEIDLGFCGGLRAARTTLVDDDIFGRIALGGELEVVGERLHVHPRDGVRRRFHARLEGARMDLEIHDGGRLSGEAPLVLGPGLDTWEAVIDHPPALPAPCACRWHRARRALAPVDTRRHGNQTRAGQPCAGPVHDPHRRQQQIDQTARQPDLTDRTGARPGKRSSGR